MGLSADLALPLSFTSLGLLTADAAMLNLAYSTVCIA